MKACCLSKESNQPHNIFKKVALVGNPNCGKTTLFNALTGAKQRVGNWPGVTVEKKSGFFTGQQKTIEVIDLPGIYSLSLASDDGAIDEQIATDYLLSDEADLIVNIVDASNLERQLYLTAQLMEMQRPVVLALNMMDVATAKKLTIDVAQLSQILGCPVVPITANRKQGIAELKQAILNYQFEGYKAEWICYPPLLKNAIDELDAYLAEKQERRFAVRLLEGEAAFDMRVSVEKTKNGLPRPERCSGLAKTDLSLSQDSLYREALDPSRRASNFSERTDINNYIATLQKNIRETLNEDFDILLADARYRSINQLLRNTVQQKNVPEKTSITKRLDAILLNRFAGIPIFLMIMYLLFFFSINIGGAFQDFFDMSSQTICVDGVAFLLETLHAPTWLIVMLAQGFGKGINTTITFIPVIGAMFLFLAFLEDSGYMARAAFVIDRLMRTLGLPGKAFIPMIVGFGCNVPAIMGARTLEHKRDRILTIMMTPFMSCGARLAIYAIFTAAFFPHGGQNIVFALYLIGIIMAVMTGFLLRKTLLKGEPSPLIMELPIYHLPRFKTLCLHAWQRLQGFVFRAGKLIVPICIVIGALNSLNLDGSINKGGDTESLLSLVGQYLTPIFMPMGVHADNWPATVGLVTGILAKEVVVGTLNTLYTQVGHFNLGAPEAFHFWGGLQAALQSIPENFSKLGEALINPILAKAPIEDNVSQGVYGLMYQKFDGKIGAFSYLLFVLLYFPCISTTAVMLKELNRGWSIFSIVWTTGVAYGAAVLFYQTATWLRHPTSSTLWVIGIASVLVGTLLAINYYASRLFPSHPEGKLA